MKHLEEDQAMSREIAKEFGEGYLPPPDTITIQKPAAFPGDDVIYWNTRTNEHTIGNVVDLKTQWYNEAEQLHRYKVRKIGGVRSVWVLDVEPLNKKQ